MTGAAVASGGVNSEGRHMPKSVEIFSVSGWNTGASLSLEHQAVCAHREEEGERYWRQYPHGEGCSICQPALVIP